MSIYKYLNVQDYGAVGDGVTDDIDAINDALVAALYGGTVVFPAGVYLISSPIGLWGDPFEFQPVANPLPVANVTMTGLAGQYGVTIKAADDFPVIAGIWKYCEITDLTLDEDNQGNSGIDAHFNATTLRRISIINWGNTSDFITFPSVAGIRMNCDTYVNPDELGLLNVVTECNIESPTSGHYGIGIDKGYRATDSWIMHTNIGSSEANLRLEGGPCRVLSCHMNGVTGTGRPRHNIVMLGGLRNVIANNILESCREESIKYVAPDEVWMTEYDQQWQIIGNSISNGGHADAGAYSAISIQGKNGDHHARGFVISNNVIAAEESGAGWEHAVSMKWCDDIALVGNIWYDGYSVSDPVRLVDCSSFDVIGNGNRNGVTTS